MLAGRSRQFISGALRLVRYFEYTRRIQHLGELDEGLRLLEEFLAACKADGWRVPGNRERDRGGDFVG